ncbi:OR49B protein, partial [Pseudoatta argentina]
MDFFDTRYFRINKFFLSFIGLWPYQTSFIKLLTQSFAIFGVTIMCAPQIAYMFKHVDDLDNMFEFMPILAGTVICIAKIISLTCNSEMFKGLLQHMKDDWNNLLTSEETQILTHYAEKSRTLILAYSISVIGFVFCYALLPLTEPVFDIILPLNETRPRKLPHLADFVIIDQEKYYYTLLLILYVGYVVCVSIAVAADILYIFLVEHICGMYGVLCHRLRNLAARDDLRWIDDDYIHEEIRRYVQHCIQLHDRIRLFIEMMDSTISLFLFFDVGLGFLLHTSSCIMIIVRMGSSEIMRYVALMLMQSCRLFFNSWAGQEVTDHSVEVSIAAYNGIWYNASVKVQKLLLFLIARSQKASQITIAKLYVINLEGFTRFLFIFKHPDDLDHIIEPTLSGTVTCGVKFASLIYYFEKFKDLFQQFYDDWTNVSKKAEQIFRNYMEVSWRFTSIYTGAINRSMLIFFRYNTSIKSFFPCMYPYVLLFIVATFVIGFALLPLVNPLLDVLSPLNITRPKKFIYPAEMLVDHEKYYYILLTIMYYVYFVACVVTLAIDTIYFAFIEHACALFDILKYKLFSLDSMYPPAHKNKSVSINIRIQKCYIKIKELTQNYINLRFVDLINNTFAIYLFFEVGLGFVMHCTLCTMSIAILRDSLVQFKQFIINYTLLIPPNTEKKLRAMLWGLIAGIGDLSIIMENTSPLLIKELLEHIEETWKVIHEGPENKILLYYAEENKIFTIRYAIGLYAMWLFYTTPPIIVSGIYALLPTNETYSASFLYRLEHVLDMDKYYNLLMLHGFISVFYIVSVPIAVDNLFTLYIQHVCALFRCIKYSIEQIRGSEFTLLNPDIADDKAYHSIVSCIKLYKRIIKFSDLLSSTYATSFLIILGNIVICLSFGAAEKLIMVDNQFDEIIRILAANAAQLLHIYYLILTSQRLIDYSNELQNVIYSCYWYTISLRSRHLLRFTLMRATKPCQIKAGNIFVMSLETFSKKYVNIRNLKLKMYEIISKIIGESIIWLYILQNFIIFYFNLFIKQSIGFKVLALVTLHGDFDAIIECIPPLIIDFVCITKLVNLTCNIEKIKILLIHIQRDWRSWTIKSEFEILHKFAESGRTITIAYAGGMYAFGSLFPFLAIIPKIIGKNVTSEYSTRPVGFPYHVEYYVDLEKYYYPILIHNYLTTAMRLTTLVATDTFVTILVQHCCALFSVVRYRLEYIRKSIEQDKELALLEEDDKFYKNFTYCIQKHKDVLRFARCLDVIYTKAFFFEVGLIILAMSMSGLQATSRTINPHLAIRHASYIVAQLLHLYIVCWLGQQVIDHSDRVYTSTYRGEWYESSLKSKKLLNMIMLRSISPCTLTVGKIMILSFPSFSAVKHNFL